MSLKFPLNQKNFWSNLKFKVYFLLLPLWPVDAFTNPSFLLYVADSDWQAPHKPFPSKLKRSLELCCELIPLAPPPDIRMLKTHLLLHVSDWRCLKSNSYLFLYCAATPLLNISHVLNTLRFYLSRKSDCSLDR